MSIPPVTNLEFDDIVIDVANHQIRKADVVIDVEPKSFRLLVYLASRPDRAITKEELLREVWGGAFVSDNALTRAIAQLRKALGDDARQARYIETVPTVGYRFLGRSAIAPLPSEPPPATPAPPVPPTPQPDPVWRKLLVPVGVVLALIVAYTRIWTAREPSSPAAGVRLAEFTSSEGLDAHPAFSPDGSSIAFTSDRTGAMEIYVKSLAPGSREIAVTRDGGQNVEPAWSPDGRFLAFHSAARGGIFVVPAFGGTVLRVSEFGSQPVWLDARRIVFRSERMTSLASVDFAPAHDSNLWTVGADGAAARPLTEIGSPPGRHSTPAANPDGTHVLFASHLGGRSCVLWELNAATGALTRMSSELQYCGSPRYVGDSIVYLAATQDSTRMYRQMIDRASRRPQGAAALIWQNQSPAVVRDLAISPDGRRFAFTSSTHKSNLYTWSEKEGERPLTSENTFRVTMPVYSPDGQKIAYQIRRRGVLSDIYVSNAGGSDPIQVTTSPSPDHFATWFPDSDRVAFSVSGGEGVTLKVFSLRDRSTRNLMSFKGKALPRISPDGTAVLYHELDGERYLIKKTVLATGETQVLSPADASVGYGSWSPDVSRIAAETFEKGNTHLVVLPASGGALRRITDRAGHIWPHSWTPDGSQIAAAALWDGLWNVYLVDASSGNVKPLTRNRSPRVFLRYPSVQSGTLRLAYERHETVGNIFVAEWQ